ncbi:hypothetical protein LMG28614_00730 [Paraburkholderia ultramafica]|uniref:Uncharacterized protein n=1 Tax=Paraburkholderia ultramafica TaxID=1544867 RepID=A0A6S7B3W3_9BURK|nr:hypothetical protein [Paraburkholderia ultramafica]CAB3778782.1 hypothetical protein LMG28614_00730 [Paraburkholderia ultramafica]
MADVISRTTFYEGQILGAADLQAGVDHGPGQLARHERYLHLWGIAFGLALVKTERTTAAPASVPYVEVKVAAGVAIDGTGRELVVPNDTPLSESEFDQFNVAVGATSTDWFPVFLVGLDEVGAPSGGGSMGCTADQASRTVESFLLQFGRPGDATIIDTQTPAAVADGPGSGGWKVLLGFVQWNNTIKKFADVNTIDQGIAPRYAGVQADEIAARGGQLVLRSKSRSQAGAPAVVIDASTGGGELRFGAQDAGGAVQPVFRVTAKGDVIATGQIQGAATPGSVQVQSGTATDGIILPLPPGVTEDMVAPGKATLHVQLTPRLDGTPPDPTGKWANSSLKCSLGADRRLNCLIRWFNLATAAPIVPKDLPGLCDYMIVVSVPAAGGP